MSYYFKSKYQFSDHGLLRIKNRLKVKKMSDLELKSYCEELIDTSHEIDETKTYKYVKVNKTDLYFIIKKIDNLIITLTPMKPEKLLSNLEKNL